MPATTAADVFIPEVATRVATATFPERLALGFAGSPFVQPFPPEASLGVEGDQVKFPRWNAMGAFGALSENVAMTPEKLTSSMDLAVVQAAGKAAEITDFATLAARGDPSTEVGRQMAMRGAQYVDAALITEAETTTLSVDDTGGTMTWALFSAAIIAKWGDKAFEELGGLVVHSKVLGDMLSLDEFKQVDNIIGALELRNRQRGERTPVGVFGGYPVYVSDRITVAAGPAYHNLVLKRGGLGLKFQRELLVETDRDILKKSDVIAGDLRFSVHLMYDDPAPVMKHIVD